MLTAKEIIMATIEAMDDKQRNKIFKTKREYVVVKCYIFNTGIIVDVKCTDRYRNVRIGSGYNYIIESANMIRYVRSYIKNNS